MSLINNNNPTCDSTKIELYNSYQNIKKFNFFDEKTKDNISPNQKIDKLIHNENNSTSDSKQYCLTSSNVFNQYKNKIISITNTNKNTNSFNLINNSFKDILTKKNTKKSISSQIKNIKKKILSINEKSPKKSNFVTYNNFIKKNKTKSYYKEDMKKTNLLSHNNLINNNINQTKFKQLKFKVFHSINNNYMPLCPHFLEKTESINKKILDYYSSNNYKKILKIYNKNLHYKTNIEAHPKIDIYVNFAKINNESSFTNKLNIDKLFNKEEKQLILLEPDYYFKNTYKDCFENINIIKSNKLVEKMNLEDMMQEELEKKKKRKKLKKIKIKKIIKRQIKKKIKKRQKK